jgi:hypothetical protein
MAIGMVRIPETPHTCGYDSDSALIPPCTADWKLQYQMLVDKHARQARRPPKYELRTFFGQLQHIFLIRFPATICVDLGLDVGAVIILAVIKTCVLDNPDTQLQGLDINFYSLEGAAHVIDVTSVQCLVGRIRDRNRWAIVDRSGCLARAIYVEDQ